MIIWGGWDGPVLNTGARYDPAANSWLETSIGTNVPTPRELHSAVWTGEEMIIWGGTDGTDRFSNTASIYCACADDLPPVGSPSLLIEQQSSSAILTWSSLPTSTGYDVVRGDAVLLSSSGGDFTNAIEACLAEENGTTSLIDPDIPGLGDAHFYLVRARNCAGVATWNSSGPFQQGDRDPGIAAAPAACP